MGLTAILGGEQEVPLATNTGWGNVGRFLDEADGEYPLLRHLFEFGWTQQATELIGELRQAASDAGGDVEKTLNELADAIDGTDYETVKVTNGFVPDDGKPDDTLQESVRMVLSETQQRLLQNWGEYP